MHIECSAELRYPILLSFGGSTTIPGRLAVQQSRKLSLSLHSEISKLLNDTLYPRIP